MTYQTLAVEQRDAVAFVTLDRPDKANAMEEAMWHEIREAMRWADATDAVRVVVLRGAGKHFTAGIDLAMLQGIAARIRHADPARASEKLRRLILDLQDTLTSVERCRKPVIAAIHGACYGGGIDLVTACDLRYCSADARFSVKEIDVGMTADVGTLQRLPKLVGEGIARELAYTGRVVDGAEAQAIRLVNRVFDTPEALAEGVLAIAESIAAKSPLAIRGIKEMITYARDHGVADRLWELYEIRPTDSLAIASNSGANGSTVALALRAKTEGIPVIAVTSLEHSRGVTSKHPSGKRLFEVADVVIDNRAPFGDTTVPLSEGLKVGAVSSLTAAYVAQLLTIGAAARLREQGVLPPLYISANIPGGDEHNHALQERYGHRIRPYAHLGEAAERSFRRA